MTRGMGETAGRWAIEQIRRNSGIWGKGKREGRKSIENMYQTDEFRYLKTFQCLVQS
jgi:hypothetical protein